MSTASMRKRCAGTPASSSAIAIEYGSSPVEHGRLRRRQDTVRVRRQPFLVRQASERRERVAVAEEPGLRHDDRFDQLLQFGVGRADAFPVGVRIRRDGTPPAAPAPRARSPTSRSRPRSAPSTPSTGLRSRRAPIDRPSAALNNMSRTDGGSSVRTSIHCSRPRASVATGPRYGAPSLVTPDGDEVRRLAPHRLRRPFGDQPEQMRVGRRRRDSGRGRCACSGDVRPAGRASAGSGR